jgi:hypothetical protein
MRLVSLVLVFALAVIGSALVNGFFRGDNHVITKVLDLAVNTVMAVTCLLIGRHQKRRP